MGLVESGRARVRDHTFTKNDYEYIMREFLRYWKFLFSRKMETTACSRRPLGGRGRVHGLFKITLLR